MSSSVRRLLLFTVLLGWCGVLLAFRVYWWRSTAFLFLPWNLFLAAVPAVAAGFLETLNRSGRAIALQTILFLVWILFLPNAFYIVTDFIHLQQQPPVPLWYDIALLVCGAGTGLLLGYSSVLDVQMVVTRRAGRAAGWGLALGSLVLSGLGIFLGRFLRWNSWDALARPNHVFSTLAEGAADPLSHRVTLAVTAIYGITVALGYVALRVIASSLRREHPASRTQ